MVDLYGNLDQSHGFYALVYLATNFSVEINYPPKFFDDWIPKMMGIHMFYDYFSGKNPGIEVFKGFASSSDTVILSSITCMLHDGQVSNFFFRGKTSTGSCRSSRKRETLGQRKSSWSGGKSWNENWQTSKAFETCKI